MELRASLPDGDARVAGTDRETSRVGADDEDHAYQNEEQRFGWIVEIDPRDPGSDASSTTVQSALATSSPTWSE